jgi:hypothetical protein
VHRRATAGRGGDRLFSLPNDQDRVDAAVRRRLPDPWVAGHLRHHGPDREAVGERRHLPVPSKDWASRGPDQAGAVEQRRLRVPLGVTACPGRGRVAAEARLHLPDPWAETEYHDRDQAAAGAPHRLHVIEGDSVCRDPGLEVEAVPIRLRGWHPVRW